MTKKTVIFVVSTAGVGNHMLNELFAPMGFKEISDNPIHLWPLYVKAVSNPLEMCSDLLGPGLGELTYQETLRRLYGSWGYYPDSADLESEELAKSIFRQIITEGIKDEHLLITHRSHYSQSMPYKSGLFTPWSQFDSDRAFRLLSESLFHESISAKYLVMVRHPLALYLHRQEGSGKSGQSPDHQEGMTRITGYFRRVEEVQADTSLDSYLLKYEDLCNEPHRFVRKLADWTLPKVEISLREEMVERARMVPQRTSKDRPRAGGDINTSVLEEIAGRFGYRWEKETGFLDVVKTRVGRFVYEMGVVAKAVSGNLNSTSVVYRHTFSVPSRAIIRLIRTLPVLSSRWERVIREHNEERLYTVQPEARTTMGVGARSHSEERDSR